MNFRNATLYSFIIAIAVILLGSNSLTAQEFAYDDAWSTQGMNLTQQNRSGVDISYSITNFSVIEESINGKQMKNIVLPGTFLPNDEGMPNLPGISRYIAIPNGAKAVLKVNVYRTDKIDGLDIAPAPRIPLETEDGLYFEANEKVYSTNEFYPKEPVTISEVTSIRGVDAVMVGITPYQYNPVTKELIIYRDIQLEVSFEGGDGNFGEDRLRSPWFDPIHQDIFLNSASLPEIDYNKRRNDLMTGRPTGCEYLIVTPNGSEFIQWADSIKKFRQEQGILTKVVTLSDIGGTTPAQLETYFNNAYNTWDIPPVAILLLADYGSNANNSITSPIYNNYCVSDNIFADVTGNHMPDMIFARITANNASQLQVMISKFLKYERNPPTNPNFYSKPITALGWQTERWFQICSETVGGFWRNQGKTPVRINQIYSGTPGSVWSTATNTATVVNYFGPNGRGYIPATPAELGGWTGGSAAMVNNAVNQGAFMLQHRDHGYELGWGEPAYSNSNISSLTNTDLTFVFSINCLTGKYNYGSECFTEKFHRHTYAGQNSGALGLIAASETSYSFVNDAYVWGLFDNMYPEFLPDYGMPVEERGLLPSFGNAAGKYFLQQSSWPYNVNNKQVTYHLFHHHGCAFLNVYSEVPQNMAINFENTLPSGESVFNITANAGAFIALTVNGEIIGTGTGTGAPQAISITPQESGTTILVTITKQNYYRYKGQVQVMTQNLPNIVMEAYQMNDQNGNNKMEYAENISIGLTLKNIGNIPAENLVATLSTTSEYITITSATAQWSVINPDATVTVDAAFTFDVHNNIPNNYEVPFNVAVTNGSLTWDMPMTITAYAPVVSVLTVSVLDLDGNGNGQLDPNETATVVVMVENTGGSPVNNFMVDLQSLSPYVIVETESYSMDILDNAGSISPQFTVNVIQPAPAGIMVNLDFTIGNEIFSFDQNLDFKVGQLIETFETGDFNQMNWNLGGDVPWIIEGASSQQGTYSAKSGTITDGQISTMQVALNVAKDDNISFYFKVSSEANFDFLRFYMDDVLVDSWSGEIDWTQVIFPVQAGPRVFKWVYEKNGANSSGSDCAWIDMISMPAIIDNILVSWAGNDAMVCEGLTYTLDGFANNHESFVWLTSGDGTFSDPGILNPVYNPGVQDYLNGSVILSLKAMAFINSITDDMILTFDPLPLVAETPGGETMLCINAGTTEYTTIATHATGYTWSFSPAEAGTLTNNGATASIAWNPEWTGVAELKAYGMNDCGEGTYSEPLTITVTPMPAIPAQPSGETAICQGTGATTYQITGAANAESYTWEIQPATAGTVVINGLNAEVNWAAGFSGSASLKVKAMNYCGESEFSDALTVNIAPLPVAAATVEGKIKACLGNTETYNTTEIANATAYEWLIEPAEAATVTSDGNACSLSFNGTWTGNATIKVRGVNDCGTGDWSEGLTLLVEDCTGISEKEMISLSIYPNPSTGNFTISFEAHDEVSITMVNSIGKQVYSQSGIKASGMFSQTINPGDLSQGVYYLTIKGKTINVTEKIVIRK